MKFIISFPGNAFTDVADAYEFGNKYSLFEKKAILWNNRRGYIEYDHTVAELLVKEGRRNYTLMEQYSPDLNFGKNLTFRYEHNK